jgi:hypothetical protein
VIITIGDGTSSDTFADIDWGDDTHSLKVEIDIEQDASFVDIGTTQFLEVPYALHAKTASTLSGGVVAALQAQITNLQSQITVLTPAVIGDIREGGVVFWVNPTDPTHGYVCAINDSPTLLSWGPPFDLPTVPNVTTTPPFGIGAALSHGFSNTNNILNDWPPAPAALYARSIGPDWYLPSTAQLNEMLVNRTAINATAIANGGTAFAAIGDYWSSTEHSVLLAWSQTTFGGTQSPMNKTSQARVRPVRAF